MNVLLLFLLQQRQDIANRFFWAEFRNRFTPTPTEHDEVQAQWDKRTQEIISGIRDKSGRLVGIPNN